jgi:hypothetical protein
MPSVMKYDLLLYLPQFLRFELFTRHAQQGLEISRGHILLLRLNEPR